MSIHPETRAQLISLLSVMAWANSKEETAICGQQGVYGNAQLALIGILTETYGKALATAALARFAEIVGAFSIAELEEAIADVQQEAEDAKRDAELETARSERYHYVYGYGGR